MTAVSTPCRVLHVHSDLLWGGVEQWLLQVAHSIDRRKFQLDFFAATVGTVWERAAADLRLNLISSPRPRAMWSYVKRLRETLHERRYDVVHCHFIDHSGIVMREAARAGAAVRIVHSHIDLAPVLGRLPIWARAYVRVQHSLLQRYATRGVAASREAAQSMFGNAWQADDRWSVLHCGIDVEAFSTMQDRAAVLAEFGIPHDAVVLGHLGRFMPQKNHAFLFEVAAAVIRRMPEGRFLWIGEGPLENEFRTKAEAAGILPYIVFAGSRSDVPRLMHAMDAFVFPSLYEGLGLALVEAQAAGLRCFASEAIPAEATVVPGLMSRLPLEAGPEVWAESIVSSVRNRATVDKHSALDAVRASAFNIQQSVRKLEALYGNR